MGSNWIPDGLRLVSHYLPVSNLNDMIVLCQVSKQYLRRKSEKLQADLVGTVQHLARCRPVLTG